MKISGSVEKVSVLVAIGVSTLGHKMVLPLQEGDKELALTWRELFKDVKNRNLNGSKMLIWVMDGLPGLEKFFTEEFPKAKTQRCQVHVARNVLAKVRKKIKKDVADDLRSIYYAKKKALDFFNGYKSKWEQQIPSAVKTLERSLDYCLTYLEFPEEEWISLRTSNIIDRLNKEFRRRSKPMEIMAEETSCYRLLAFIPLRWS